MRAGALEHVNITVSDAKKTAELLCKLFGWKIRWSGPSQLGGFSVHVGSEDRYIALYTLAEVPHEKVEPKPIYKNALNHIGIVVDDLQATEQRVKAAGYVPQSHADYEPGRRFYFYDIDDIEYEVVSYS